MKGGAEEDDDRGQFSAGPNGKKGAKNGADGKKQERCQRTELHSRGVKQVKFAYQLGHGSCKFDSRPWIFIKRALVLDV